MNNLTGYTTKCIEQYFMHYFDGLDTITKKAILEEILDEKKYTYEVAKTKYDVLSEEVLIGTCNYKNKCDLDKLSEELNTRLQTMTELKNALIELELIINNQ